MTLLLTPDELRDLTGTKQPKRQADWLKARGWVLWVGLLAQPVGYSGALGALIFWVVLPVM